MLSSSSSSPSSSSIDVELLLDRLLSASTPTDCLDSLDQLQSQCRTRLRRTKQPSPYSSSSSQTDPKTQRPSQAEELDDAKREAEAAETERQSAAIDTVLRNGNVLHALCSLVACSILPSQQHHQQQQRSNDNKSSGMEVEGGDVAACELLLVVLPSPPPPSSNTSSNGGTNNAGHGTGAGGGATTEALQAQRLQKRRMEYISKTLLHFHEANDSNNKERGMDVGGAAGKLALTPSLLDCLCASPTGDSNTTTTPSVYARVLSLQLLQSLLSASPGALREQLMKAPDGINRLVDLLGHGSNTMGATEQDDEPSSAAAAAVPEEVRNEAILFLSSLASSSSMLARLITFSEGYDRALKIALESAGGGLPSSGSSSTTIAMDCLELCLALSHADEVARELFLGGGDGRGNLDRLARLVDLRGGERFRDEGRNLWWDRESKEKKKRSDIGGRESAAAASEGTRPKESTGRKGGKRGKKAKDDDLDDILRGASSTPSAATTAPKKTDDAQPDPSRQGQPPTVPEGPPTPYLTPNETNIVHSVFKLLLVLLRDGDEASSTMPTAARSLNDASRSKRRGRAKAIVSHDLARCIVDCALYTLPPPGVDYVSAVPPPSLQQEALVTMAVLGSLGDTVLSEREAAQSDGKQADSEKDADAATAARRRKEADEETKVQTQLLFETMPIYLQGRVTAIDRLMYICCTGAYAAAPDADDDSLDERERPHVVASLLSAHSISTFRSCLPREMASRMVLHALAPPPPDETDASGAPLEPPVVTRLVTTLADNLRFLQSQHQEDQPTESSKVDIHRATIGASGSAGALGVFLTRGEGDATREMLLRLVPPPPPRPPTDGPESPTAATTVDSGSSAEPSSANLIDFILQHVSMYDPDSSSSNTTLHASSAYITATLLRLLCEWVIGMPRAVTEVLSSPSSVSVGVLVRSKKKKKSGGDGPVAAAEAVPALSGLLLGLCLEYMAGSDSSAAGSSSAGETPDMENIAWTRETIMNLIQSMGVGKYLNMIDEWKKRPIPLPYCRGEERSSMERRAFAGWYGHNVTLVRRRVVMTLAGSRGEDDSDDSDADDKSSSWSLRSLRKMMSSQAHEIEDLQAKLEDALLTISSQSTQIKELKRVNELGSTSAETIDMVSEYTEKVAELEKSKAELKKEAEHQTKMQEEALSAKGGEIEAIRKELQESQTCVEEMRRDNETLSEEMSGLSSAYNVLEQRYHHSNSGVSSTTETAPTEMTAGGETAAEDGGVRDRSSPSVPGGEAAAEDPGRTNHEAQSLRDENARLREEGRAANDWMQMAVSKMEEMSGENESLALSLEEARTMVSSGTNNAEDPSAIQSELDGLRMEMQNVSEESDAKLRAKDDQLSEQQALVQQLGDQIEEMKLSTANKDSAAATSHSEELKQELARQVEELESLRKANKDAQDWMASAVTHVDTLTKEVQEKDAQLAKLQSAGEDVVAPSSNESESKIAGLEKSLLEITSDRDELQMNLAKTNEEMSALQEASEGLRKVTDASQAQDSSEKEALKAELDQVKVENTTLTSNLSEFQSWSETAQIRLAEVETKLQETATERDELKTQLEANVSEGTKSISQENNNQITILQDRIREKNDQLERMQDQLIEDAEENDAKTEKLQDELQEENQRADDLSQEGKNLSAMIEKLSLEKEELSSTLAVKQSEMDSLNAGKNDATLRAGEAQRRIAELEAAKSSAEAQVDKLMALEDQGRDNIDDQIITITAEKNELQSQLDDITEEYEEAQKSLERIGMENGNLLARIRAIEQDNKSLEYQFTDLGGKVKDLNDLLAAANDEKTTMHSALDEMKTSSAESVQLWQLQTQTLQTQLEQQEKDAMEAVAQWETRCTSLEGSGEGVIRQWEERVQSLQAELEQKENQLEQQEKEASEAIAQWEARCSTIEESGGDVIRQWEERVQALQGDVVSLEYQLGEKESILAISNGEKSSLQSVLDEMKAGSEESVQLWQERAHALEADVTSLSTQLEQQEKEAADAVAQWEARCSTLEESGGDVIRQWEERVQSLQAELEQKEKELEQQEQEVAEAIAQWEARCSTLEESGGDVIHQWEERVQSLEAELEQKENQLEQQEKEASDAIAQWEARCSTIEESGGDVIRQWEERVQSLQAELEQQEQESADAVAQWETRCLEVGNSLNATKAETEAMSMKNQELESNIAMATSQIEDNFQTIESMQLQIKDKYDALASSDDQVSELARELLETQNQSEQVLKQWQERSEQLEANIVELDNAIQEHENRENDAAEAISQWEERCATLSEKISQLELQIVASEKDSTVADLQEEVASITTKLEANKSDLEKTQGHLNETNELLAQRGSEWKEKETCLTATIEQLESTCSEHQKKTDEERSSLNSLEEKCSVLAVESTKLQQERKDALKESEESQVIVLELQEELRHAKEELQAFATDQFTVKATEMATQALRQQMVEIRSQYAIDQEALTSERDARLVAEEEVDRLKSDLALLAQATEYDEGVDVHVRKVAKRVSAENVKAERKEMAELRSTLERLREELGSCRWKERESEEKASNARLQMSILEQEVSAAKTDLALMEQNIEDLETSKIEMSVSLEYRIEALENDRLMADQSYEEEIHGIKAELAQANQERDNLVHKLEQSEKANAALVYSTSHDGPGGEESESEVIKLQLERAQLLAKINDIGVDLERRVREAVAAQASSSEAELIVEKQSRKSVELSLADALSELDEFKMLVEQTSKTKGGELSEKERIVLQDLEESLDDMRMANGELVNNNKLLEAKLDTSDKENKYTIDDLKTKLQIAEERLRSEERESRFEAAISSEIANLRASTHTVSNGTQKNSQALILRGIDQNTKPSADEGKESIDRNSAYIIEMYDYVCELKSSITEERQMYKHLLSEHEDLLALLGQTGFEGM